MVPLAASINLWVAEAVLTSNEAPVAKSMKLAGYNTTRQVIMHGASETNRFIQSKWGLAQIGLGLIVLALLLAVKAGPAYFAAAGLSFIISIGLHFVLTREISGIGRLLDFKDAGIMLTERSRLENMQRIYWSLQAVVVLVTTGLLGAFLKRNRSRRLGAPIRPLNHVNAVYDTDNAHVDG